MKRNDDDDGGGFRQLQAGRQLRGGQCDTSTSLGSHGVLHPSLPPPRRTLCVRFARQRELFCVRRPLHEGHQYMSMYMWCRSGETPNGTSREKQLPNCTVIILLLRTMSCSLTSILSLFLPPAPLPLIAALTSAACSPVYCCVYWNSFSSTSLVPTLAQRVERVLVVSTHRILLVLHTPPPPHLYIYIYIFGYSLLLQDESPCLVGRLVSLLSSVPARWLV